jgi:hypothetical protein
VTVGIDSAHVMMIKPKTAEDGTNNGTVQPIDDVLIAEDVSITDCEDSRSQTSEKITGGDCEDNSASSDSSMKITESSSNIEILLDGQEETGPGNDGIQTGHVSQSETEGAYECQVVIDRLRSVTIRAPICVAGQKMKAVVDTGAEVTVLSETVYQAIPAELRPQLQQAKKCLVVAEAGKEMKTRGLIHADLELGDLKFTWPMYVAPIADDLLLGCDVIDAKDITVNTKKGLEIEGQWVECEVIRASSKVGRVTLRRSVTVPANCEFVVTGINDQKGSLETEHSILEPLSEENHGIVIARSFVSSAEKHITIRLVNLSKSPVKLKKGYVFGELHPTEDFCEAIESKEMGNMEAENVHICRLRNTNESCVGPTDGSKIGIIPPTMPQLGDPVKIRPVKEEVEIPEHLTDLYKRSVENIASTSDQQKLAELLKKHKDAFAKDKMELGTCSLVKHRIETAGAAPVRQPLRRTPQGFEGEEEKYLKDQLDCGVVRPSNSAWASPIVLVRKKDGSVRWCIDYRKVNDVTIKDAYPLPRIDMCIDCLATAKIFSTFDLQAGYWQLKLDEKDCAKTAFITKYGLFEYTKMPFGLCNAPSTFQRCMELVLRGLQWKILLIYLDDIILYSSTLAEHFEQLDVVMTRLSAAGLKLKPSKCELVRSEVLFLGHIVGQDGVKPNPKTIEAISSWKPPRNVKEVRSYLGLCNYYRQFIHRFSDIAAPLTRLTKKDAEFLWTIQCQEAYETLKKALCTAPVLAYPMPTGQYILDTDASNVGIGAVLSQIQEGKEKVIAYASKKLDKPQQRYSVTRRELLAVVTFVHQFRHYLLGKKFLIRTDHGSLRWLFGFKDPQGQLARWLEVLYQYDFQIQHREGRKHTNADSMSRRDYESTFCHEHRDTDVMPTECDECQKLLDEWMDFKVEVDNVTHLSDVVNKQTGRKAAGPTRKSEPRVRTLYCRRMTTRNQGVKPNLEQAKTGQTSSPTLSSNWVGGYTPKEMEDLQRGDSDIALVHKWIDAGQPPSRDEAAGYSPATRNYWLNWNNLTRENGVLYQKRKSDSEKKTDKCQLLIPKLLRKEVLRDSHDNILAGHFGINKTIQKLRERFHWYRMGEDVKLHIKHCKVCDQDRHPPRKARAALTKYHVGYPMDRVALDVMGPLPTTRQGNNYILVIGDHFTRWIEAYPIPNQQAPTIAQYLVHQFVARFGTPLEIHTDQGRNFESGLFRELCRLLDVTKTRTTPYHPASNGVIERFNRTLGKMMKSFVDDNQSDWDIHLGLLTAAYRSTIHPATGFSPNQLMLGREVNSPSDILFPRPAPEEAPEVHDYVRELREKMENCYHIARENLKRTAERQKIDYDTRIAENTYKTGDFVFKRNPICRKLQHRWLGPYIVTETITPALYRLQGKNRTCVVHHDLLKPYQSSAPKWAIKMQKDVCRKL